MNRILGFDEFVAINEGLKLNILKNGTIVRYSEDGQFKKYRLYICLTEKDDKQYAIDNLKWKDTITNEDKKIMLKANCVMVCSDNGGANYVLKKDIVLNNITFVYDAGAKIKDAIKKDYLKDLEEFCDEKNIVYEKDVTFNNMVLVRPDPPEFNGGFRFNDYSDMSRGYDAYGINTPSGVQRGTVLKLPDPFCL